MDNLIYKIDETPKTIRELLLYAAQQCISILTATILISTICGTNVAAGFVGAGVATITFLILTKFKAPLFFSNSGSTCAAVITALSLGHDYTGVILGGITICIMNTVAALITKKVGSDWVNKLLPPVVSGTIVAIIGLNLAGFCATYVGMGNEGELPRVIVALITMLITVLTMYYARGRLSTLPFLVGVIGGYFVSYIFGLTRFDSTQKVTLFSIPDFAFLHVNFKDFDWSLLPTIIVTFGAVNLANMGEHISDVLAVSTVVGEDLTKKVGLHKTFLGDGIADLVGTLFSGQPTTTYSESLSTIAVSRVASTKVIFVAALMTILLGFFDPLQRFILTIPNCVFGGVALVRYGMIARSGVKVMTTVDYSKQKNVIITAVMLTIGISGVALHLGQFTLETIALSMVTGLVLNIILN